MAAHPATLSLIFNPHATSEIWITNQIHRRLVYPYELGLYYLAGWTVDSMPAEYFDHLPVA